MHAGMSSALPPAHASPRTGVSGGSKPSSAMDSPTAAGQAGGVEAAARPGSMGSSAGRCVYILARTHARTHARTCSARAHTHTHTHTQREREREREREIEREREEERK